MIRADFVITPPSNSVAFTLTEEPEQIAFCIRAPAPAISYDVSDIVVMKRGDYPGYGGATTVIPKAWESQVLPTQDTTVFEDITVTEIPITRVGNPYGDTITIG